MSTTREQILDAAAERFANGDSPSVEEIARDAGVSRSTIYRQFGSRAGLLSALADAGVDLGAEKSIRERVLRAARVVYGRVGLHGATIEQIAVEAGVGEASIYRHFGSHEELTEAFVQWTRETSSRTELLDSGGPMREVLERFAAETIRNVADNRAILRLVLSGDELGRELRTARTRTLGMLEGYMAGQIDRGRLEDDVPARELARTFSFLLLGYGLFSPALYDDEFDPDEVGALATRVFLDAVEQY